MSDVLVVGAGLAGLRAAQVLDRAGVEVTLIDAAREVGGRARSYECDGFVLDRGFQLINPAYPELLASAVLPRLDLRRFAAVIRFVDDDGSVELADPRVAPWRALSALRHPDLGVADAAHLARLLGRVWRSPVSRLLAGTDRSKRDALTLAGVSERAIDGVVAPFLRGTFLDDELETSWHYAQMVLKSFTRGRPGTPSHGVGALARALAESLTRTTLRLGEEVLNVSPRAVETDQARYEATAVIVAVDAARASRLAGVDDVAWRSQTTWWWSLPRLADSDQLRIDRRRRFLSSTLDVSSVAPERAPRDRSLVAAAANGLAGADEDERVRDDVARLYAVATRDVELVSRDDVRHALPRVPAALRRRPPRVGDVFVAGDYLETPSIQGALVSGRHAAQAVLTALQGRG